ncbi:hydroxypyruvate reductase (plasmid) [Pararhizobium polonicum]|uniref:Hydroxypyruvate reductase n=1 Tax=Pararhizobium polonicum TaxID=1612624 RepID=A0A1C7P8M6_9HYPH|nr:glycerate kinase [Pararhizobium polonicum]OBZ97598.1 hydroxypyruvate reductase [Pararhizobium polonicum]
MKPPRELLASMFHAAVKAADPLAGMKTHLPAKPTGRTIVVGAGKGAAQMACALETIWDGPLEGVVVTRYGYGCTTRDIKIVEASHPVPDAAGLDASAQLMKAVSNLSSGDLVIALICGGGSALLPAPPIGLTLQDEIVLNESLLASGAPISAMNVIRKHLSTIKGGRLASATKARVVTFVVSDIPGDNASHVSSGPTVPDHSTRHEALELVQRYDLKLPTAVITHLNSPEADAPSPESSIFARNEVHIIASAGMSLEAAAAVARSEGMEAAILSDSLEGEADAVALFHAAIAREVFLNNRPFKKPVAIISGGETTVTVRNKRGKGGRNGQFALALAVALDGYDVDILAADTDGIDGSESNAGAFADGRTVQRMRAAGIDAREALRSNNSYVAFSSIGDLFETGPTGTNVNDFRVVLAK